MVFIIKIDQPLARLTKKEKKRTERARRHKLPILKNKTVYHY